MGSSIDASRLLRPGLLQGVSLLIAGGGGAGSEVRSACAELGASVAELSLQELAAADAPGAPADGRAGPDRGRVDLLFVDGAELFARAGADAGARGDARDGADAGARSDAGDGEHASAAAAHSAERPAGVSRAALLGCLDGAWAASRSVANAAFIEPGRSGRIVYLAPAPDAGPLADAALAGLENLARTLSIEWSRFGITLVAIAPRGDSDERELAALVAYLASPAGAYFSGCLLDLRGPA